MSTNNFFTYQLLKGGRILREGKGGVPRHSLELAEEYLQRAYPERGWNRYNVKFHSSEAAALKEETRLLDAYVRAKGKLPPWNEARGGGGRQVFARCKAITQSAERCRNDALQANYGFCGRHRRVT